MHAEIPIIGVGEYLVAPLQESLDQSAAAKFGGRLLETIARQRPAGVLIDVSAIPLFDLVDFARVARLARQVRLMGVPSAISGLSPAAAASLALSGTDTSSVLFCRDLAQGIELLGGENGPAPSQQEKGLDRLGSGERA